MNHVHCGGVQFFGAASQRSVSASVASLRMKKTKISLMPQRLPTPRATVIKMKREGVKKTLTPRGLRYGSSVDNR